ncbi:hypothetical protein [Azospirillum largimobile]
MDTSLFPFPDALSFAEISRTWSQCPGAPDAEEIQTVLVRAMWRGAFERDGEPLTFLFRRPENRTLPDGSTIRYDGEADGIVTRSVRRPPGSDHSDEESRGVMTSEREKISFSRALILEAMHYLRPEHGGDPFAHLTFEGMAAVSLSKYDPAARAAYLDHLRLSPTDLAEWFSSAPLNWPRPAWLPSDAVATEPNNDAAALSEGGMRTSRFWTLGQSLHWIVFRGYPADDEQITHTRLCLRYGASSASATMGPNEALDELQAALEEGRLSASGQRSMIARDMIGDRRQIGSTRRYVPEVFWHGAQIDRDRMGSAVDATGERWTALLCPQAVVTSLWPPKPIVGNTNQSNKEEFAAASDETTAAMIINYCDNAEETSPQRKKRIAKELAEWAPIYMAANGKVDEATFHTAAIEKFGKVTRAQIRAEHKKYAKLTRGEKPNRQIKSPRI